MKKLVLLVVVLALVAGSVFAQQLSNLTMPMSIRMTLDGNDYKHMLQNDALFGGHTITQGDVFILKGKATASRDVNKIWLNIIDQTGRNNYWWNLAANDVHFLGEDIKANEEFEFEVEIPAINTATNGTRQASTLFIYALGRRGGTITLNFSEFTVSKK